VQGRTNLDPALDLARAHGRVTAGSSTPDYVIVESEERLSTMIVKRQVRTKVSAASFHSPVHEADSVTRFLALVVALRDSGRGRGRAELPRSRHVERLNIRGNCAADFVDRRHHVSHLRRRRVEDDLSRCRPRRHRQFVAHHRRRGKSGFYAYETQIEASGQRTLMTYHAYSWKDKSRKERTLFDYATGVARLHKETPEKQWDKVDRHSGRRFHDVVSAIYYLRQNAPTMPRPVATTIYSDGKSYPVIVRPANRQTFAIGGQQVGASGFEIVDRTRRQEVAGGMKSGSRRRAAHPVPHRDHPEHASLQLDLQSIDSCAFMQASK